MATPTTCLSSKMMSELLAWRNPRGVEDNWYKPQENVKSLWVDRGRVVITEFCAPLLFTMALVESVAYAALFLVAIVLLPCTEDPIEFAFEALDSSTFVLLWAAANLVNNLVVANLWTHESLARYHSWFGQDSLRASDTAFVEAWNAKHLVPHGADVIVNHVLKDADEDTLTSFVSMYPVSIMNFVSTKAIYLYAKESAEPIPSFFKLETRERIEQFRAFHRNGIPSKALDNVLSNLQAFNDASKADGVLSELCSIGSEEQQGESVFIKQCYLQAREALLAQDSSLVPTEE